MFDDDCSAAAAALETSPIVLEMSLDQGDDAALRGLSWAICAIAGRCSNPAEVVRSFAEQLQIDLAVALSGVRGGDDVQDRCTTSDSWGRQRERDLWPH